MFHLVVTTDFSNESFWALEFAREQAELRGSGNARVTLLAVLEDPNVATITFEFGFAPIITEDRFNEIAENATKRLRALGDQYLGTAVRFDAKVIRARGAIATEIVDFVRDEGADALVIATHGRTGVQHLLLGSVAEGAIRGLKCPVYVVPTRKGASHNVLQSKPRHLILVATDFSPEAEKIFPVVSEQATLYREHESQIELLHVVDDVLVASYHQSLGSNPEKIWQELEQAAIAKLEDTRSRFVGGSLSLTTVTRQEKSIGEDIVNFAKARGVSLIILGTHGRKGLPHAMLGSVAETVVRLSLCPVIVVPMGVSRA